MMRTGSIVTAGLAVTRTSTGFDLSDVTSVLIPQPNGAALFHVASAA